MAKEPTRLDPKEVKKAVKRVRESIAAEAARPDLAKMVREYIEARELLDRVEDCYPTMVNSGAAGGLVIMWPRVVKMMRNEVADRLAKLKEATK